MQYLVFICVFVANNIYITDIKSLHSNSNKFYTEMSISALSGREQVSYQWDDGEVRFVLDQHAQLVLHSVSSL